MRQLVNYERTILRKLILTIVLVCILCGQCAIGTAAASSKDKWLWNAFICIHIYEGSWNANTGNGYYGGLQMDFNFMSAYGHYYLHRYGTANNWSPAIQIKVAIKAYKSGRGFGPWPNTRKKCGV